MKVMDYNDEKDIEFWFRQYFRRNPAGKKIRILVTSGAYMLHIRALIL
jgi:hypothetical protein